MGYKKCWQNLQFRGVFEESCELLPHRRCDHSTLHPGTTELEIVEELEFLLGVRPGRGTNLRSLDVLI